MEDRDQGSGMTCNPHPDAPHGFLRDASHSAGRYVCECEFWKPQGVKIHAGPYGDAWIAQEEPVAWMFVNEDGECEQIEYGPVFDDPGVTPLYAAPPKREWQGLTDDEKEKLVEAFYGTDIQRLEAVEAKLKEKNT